MAKDDDDAWRAIVDNYGDRPELDDPPAPVLPEPSWADLDDDLGDRGDHPGDELGSAAFDARTWDDPDSDWDTDRFVPPPPPPLPTTTPDRQAAWAGVFGAPAIVLVCLIAQVDLPAILAYALIAAFVGGFVYLVVTMTREPRDPDDDGAVL
ncbi:hypothetical protein [Nocardioides rubriscoriae]|uniref:hypothetical protein n=1 Tax=Nocardioides rubriscoriae TaxID=642762 RepID=UPI0011DF671C|nr:hypothetical protein [Nocardioides rubriscoriae]